MHASRVIAHPAPANDAADGSPRVRDGSVGAFAARALNPFALGLLWIAIVQAVLPDEVDRLAAHIQEFTMFRRGIRMVASALQTDVVSLLNRSNASVPAGKGASVRAG